MTDLQIIKGVECYIDEGGVAQLRLENVARGLGFTQVKSGTEYIRWEVVDRYVSEMMFSPLAGNDKKDFKRAYAFMQNYQRPEFIPEPIFYLLCMKAENDTAKGFQHTVAYDVLPAIRKHGLYAVDELIADPDLGIRALTALKEEREQRKLAEAEREKLKVELDYSKEWLSIKRVSAMNGIDWKSIDWRRLKTASAKIGYGVKKIFDANYGEVNTYHMRAWELAYPNLEI